MKTKSLLVTATAIAAASLAHAQYASAPQKAGAHAAWEVDAGIGYVFNTNVSGLDNGTALHLGGYKVDAANATRETTLKYGAELYYSSIDGTGNTQLDTLFASANIGMTYKFSRTVEAGATVGLGAGRHSYDVGSFSDSSNCFGYQIRPEVIFHASDRVGISVAYRFLQTFPLDSNWTTNPTQHAIELSVKYGF